MANFRGSLRQCILHAADMFAKYRMPRLGIVANPKGKYYTVLQEPDLEAAADKAGDTQQRLVFFGTFRELYEFTNTNQQSFDFGSYYGYSPKDLEAGEQPGDNPPGPPPGRDETN